VSDGGGGDAARLWTEALEEESSQDYIMVITAPLSLGKGQTLRHSPTCLCRRSAVLEWCPCVARGPGGSFS